MKLAAADATGATAQGPARTIQRWDDDVRVAEDGATVIAVCAVPVTITQEPGHSGDALTLPSGKDFVVMADTVILRGPMSAPGRSVTIIAREVRAEDAEGPDGAARTAGIDVSGEPGTDGQEIQPTPPSVPFSNQAATGWADYQPFPAQKDRNGANGANGADGQPGQDGTDGRPGGRITIIADTWSAQSRLDLRAVGGTGGAGATGQAGGDGQVGGNGFDGSAGAVAPIRNRNPTAGGRGGNGGRGGSGGVGGAGGAGGVISFRTTGSMPNADGTLVPIAPPAIPAESVEPGPSGPSGDPGANGYGASGGRGGYGFAYKMAMSFTTTVIQDRAAGDWGSPGTIDATTPPQFGRTPAPRTAPARPAGEPSTPTTAPGSMADLLAALPPSPVARECFVTLQSMHRDRIRFLHLTLGDADQPEQVQELIDRVSWLCRLLKAWAADATNPDKAGTRDLYDSVRGTSKLILGGLNPYGHESSWVPKLSLAFYLEHATKMVDAYARADADVSASRANLASIRSDKTALDGLAAHAGRAVDDANDQIEQALADLAVSVDRIDVQTRAADAAKAVLLTSIAAWKDDLRHDFMQYFSLPSLESFFETAATFAFFPEPEKEFQKSAMVIGAAGKAVMNGIETEGLVEDDSGAEVKTEWLISQMSVVSNSFQTADEGFGQVGGQLVQKDAGNRKLLASMSNLEGLTGRFYASSPDARATKAAMDDYLAAVNARNLSLITWNAQVATLRQARLELRAAIAAKKDAMNRASMSTTIGLASVARLTDFRIDSAKADCLLALYQLSRAYAFWALTTDDVFARVMGPYAYDLNASTAQQALERINSEWAQSLEGAARLDPMPPGTKLRRTGLIMSITPDDQPDLFADLKAKGSGFIDLTPSRRGAAAPPFDHMANVRLRAVRCWLHGVTSDSGIVKLALTHMGAEQVVAPDNSVLRFTHEPTTKDFWYAHASDADAYDWHAVYDDHGDGAVSDAVFGDPSDTYASLGPFTMWQISLSDITEASDGSAAVHVDGLSAITVEFLVLQCPFDAPTRPGARVGA